MLEQLELPDKQEPARANHPTTTSHRSVATATTASAAPAASATASAPAASASTASTSATAAATQKQARELSIKLGDDHCLPPAHARLDGERHYP